MKACNLIVPLPMEQYHLCRPVAGMKLARQARYEYCPVVVWSANAPSFSQGVCGRIPARVVALTAYRNQFWEYSQWLAVIQAIRG